MWIEVYFIKFEGNIANFRGLPRKFAILPKNLMK